MYIFQRFSITFITTRNDHGVARREKCSFTMQLLAATAISHGYICLCVCVCVVQMPG